jgi:protein phosphatase PTC2/3
MFSPFSLTDAILQNSQMEKVCENTVITDFKQNSQIATFEPRIRSGEYSDIGRREYMEDAHVCISDLTKNYGYNSITGGTISFYGVIFFFLYHICTFA